MTSTRYGYAGPSRWSLWSTGSLLSIGSTSSLLSIGSVGSVVSIGSIGSAASIFSVGSAASIGSALSSASAFSLLAHGHRPPPGTRPGRATGLLTAVALGALVLDVAWARRRRLGL